MYGVAGEASNNIFPLGAISQWNKDHPSMLTPSAHEEDHDGFFTWIKTCQSTVNPGACMRLSVWAGGAARSAYPNDANLGIDLTNAYASSELPICSSYACELRSLCLL